MSESLHDVCPQCQVNRLKGWNDLTDDEKMLAGRLPMSAEYDLSKRKKHRFCTRCWFEELEPPLARA